MTRRTTPRTLGQSLRRALPATALVGAVLGVTAIGPGVFSALASGLHHRAEAGVVVPPSVAPPASAAPPAVATSAPVEPIIAAAPTRVAPATTPTPDAPTSATPVPTTLPDQAATPTAPAAVAEVTTIQIVPAARDVVVEVDGASYASTSDGLITLPPAARHGSLQFIGFRETPALRQATFATWADGGASATRALDTLTGPVVQLGVTISYRVTVAAAGADSVDLYSALGALNVPVDAPRWVPAAQAVAGPEGLVPQPITYTVQSVEQAGQQVAVTPISYTPTPEALWTVTA